MAAIPSQYNGVQKNVETTVKNERVPISEEEMDALASLLSEEVSDENADNNLAEILQRLDKADGVARGVESRLDGLLENLEGLLEGLEAVQGSQMSGGAHDVSRDNARVSEHNAEKVGHVQSQPVGCLEDTVTSKGPTS